MFLATYKVEYNEESSKPRSAGVRTRSGFKLPAIPNHFSPVPSSWPLRLGTAALRVRGFERASNGAFSKL